MIDYIVDGERPVAGSLGVEEGRLRALAARVYDRTDNIAASMTNHWILEGGEPVRPRFGRITAPTLVLHETEDPLFPHGHGQALAREIPGARLVPLDGVGHQVPPPPVWDVVTSAILEHTSRSS